jgi:serine/threonine-protein kinase
VAEDAALAQTPEELGRALARASPMDVVDLLLWLLVEQAGSVTITPVRSGHAIRHEGVTVSHFATVPATFGDALVARLALVAGLAVGEPGVQVGRLRVRPAVPSGMTIVADLLVAARPTPLGLGAEVHRMASANSTRDERATPADFDAGRARVGMYRVSEAIGRGGMGVVYRAEHIALQKPVALKVIRPEVAHEPTVAAQFLVEARAACRARHPGIVDVTDFGVLSDGRSYLVMELVTWPTLAKVLDESGPMPLLRSLAIARSVADALAAAAAQGVVHRDLTPSNIFLGDGDATKLGDFGLARLLEPGAEPTDHEPRIAGTAAYMSPEQSLGEPVDSRSDVYSLGIILFRMVTGRLPFPGRTLAETVLTQLADPLPKMIGPDGPVPDSLQALVERAAAKRPEARYQTVDELLLALTELERALSPSGWRRWLE